MNYPFTPPNGSETKLNQQVTSFIYYSLLVGPSLLNNIHEDLPFEYSSKAEVIAHQRSPLPRYTDEGPNREMDWVIRDTDLLVGYESKLGAGINRAQIADELEKLRVNADDKDVKLIVVTLDTTFPSDLDDFRSEPVHWLSWYRFSRCVHQTQHTDVGPEQNAILEMFRDLFKKEHMTPFEGFTNSDNKKYRYFIRDIRQNISSSPLQNPDTVFSNTTTKPDPPVRRRLVPKYLDIPFVHHERDDNINGRRSSYFSILVDTEEYKTYAGVVFNVKHVESHQRFISTRLDDLVDYAEKRGYSMWASKSSFNHWEQSPVKTNDSDEMRAWLSQASKGIIDANGTEYEKAAFLTKRIAINKAAHITRLAEVLRDLNHELLYDNSLFPHATLEDYKQD